MKNNKERVQREGNETAISSLYFKTSLKYS